MHDNFSLLNSVFGFKISGHLVNQSKPSTHQPGMSFPARSATSIIGPTQFFPPDLHYGVPEFKSCSYLPAEVGAIGHGMTSTSHQLRFLGFYQLLISSEKGRSQSKIPSLRLTLELALYPENGSLVAEIFARLLRKSWTYLSKQTNGNCSWKQNIQTYENHPLLLSIFDIPSC